MKTALVVSRYFPFNSRQIHAVYQRLGTQIAALGRLVERVECLFLVPPEHARSADPVAQQAQLAELWSTPVALHLAPVVDERPPPGRWQRLGRGIFDFRAHPLARPLHNAAALAAVEEALRRRPQLVLAHRLSSMSLLTELRSLLRGIPLFFDMDDLEHVSWSRRLWHDPTWPAERLLLLQTPALLAAERRAVRLATMTFVCSDGDRRQLRRLTGCERICTIPNSVAFPRATPEASPEPLVLFVGSMGSRPNAHAVDFLVQQVWPRVKERVPQATLAILGSGAQLTHAYPPRDPSVSFPGFVDDLASWYRRARLVCCPIRHGSGTRVKIIEAAAYGRAIVATHIGAEGLALRDGAEILLRDRPAAIAAACIGLLEDPAAAARLGEAARARALAFYDRGAVIERLASAFQQALRGLEASVA